MGNRNPCDVQGDQGESDRIVEFWADKMQTLSKNFIAGKGTLDKWQSNMQDAIRLAYMQQAVAGTPDADVRQIKPADLERIQADIAAQYAYLDRFADDIQSAVDNGASLDFIPARAALYAQSSGATYWKQAVTVDLPAIPRDGSTQCRTNCQCSWSLDCDAQGNVTATWVIEPGAEHCPDCERRAREWANLSIPVTR